MNEQIITTREVLTLGDFRRATTTVPDNMPLRDYVKRAGLQVTLLETDQGKVLEVS
ncbi:hypothetical protein FY034_13070 [Trichlorobacter lovleyi]|uniref:hypothetical protein n=1 Tax=Trichlorobacter lovleyi TaxID=313985 RepID=UPI00223ED7A3|nr:hypothetical protein [Trichlorobacter lovleyi]QOX79822.1 hypothetical protein FY034_13070 [Trichlorobacter lovleyi]